MNFFRLSRRRFSTMRAISITENGGPEVLKMSNVPIPTCGANQILVKNRFAGLNFIDTYFRKGLYPKPLPMGVGYEGGGEIMEVGADVKDADLTLGKRVTYFGALGSYAEYTAVDTGTVLPWSNDIPYEAAIHLTCVGLTSHYLCNSVFPLTSEHTCLILAAGGGAGQLLVQQAVLKGAKVIAVTSPGKRTLVESFGPAAVCGYDDIPDVVKNLTDGAGVHVAFDSVGKATWETSMKSLRRRGTLVLYGNASGPVPPISPLDLSKNGSLYVTRPTLAHFTATAEERLERASELSTLYMSGELRLHVDKVFPLGEAQAVHEYLESGQSSGKILIDVNA